MTVDARSLHERLTEVWSRPPGLVGWLAAVNHRAIGRRYLATAFVFFLLAGAQALIMRAQLAGAESDLVSPELYDQLFTLHGTTMMFLFAVPIMEGIGIYLVPLMIGARDMIFPRLNAFGYWVYLIAGMTLYGAFFAGGGPDAGWFNYVPLSGPGYSPGVGIDIWVTTITFLEVAALVAAVELALTILKLRAPGMSMARTPLFVWAILVMSLMIIFAMPPLILASVMLGLDRMVGSHFFNAAAGGDPVLWQHLFWVFGHPEVYIIFVPALGVVSMIIPTFARRRITGYSLAVLSLLAIGFLSFGLWVHHMYTVGLPLLGLNFFAAGSMMISIPTGILIFCFIATIWRGRPELNTAMLFVIGFILTFVIGGLTGVMVASVPFDWQVHDTYFVVAHFHYVLIGGAVFPLLAGAHYWYPKLTGRMLSERIGKTAFWLIFIGFNVTFFPMHITGFRGMPRRVYTYQPGLGWEGLNLLSTLGAAVLALGVLAFTWNLVRSRWAGEHSGPDPWRAGTLEWAADSPPAMYNFLRIPIVRSRNPLWDDPVRGSEEPVDRTAERLREPVAAGASPDQPSGESAAATGLELFDPDRPGRATLATTPLDAEPDFVRPLPRPSLWPLALALALALAFIGSIATVGLVPIGAVLAYIAMLGWLWPNGEDDG